MADALEFVANMVILAVGILATASGAIILLAWTQQGDFTVTDGFLAGLALFVGGSIFVAGVILNYFGM